MSEPVDVLVLGTGCAGLLSALAAADAGARVAVFDKAGLLGGTTALSSGVAWLPGNKFQAAHGVEDSAEDGRAYLTALSNGMILPEFTDAFVGTVNEMLTWCEERTPLQMRLVPGYPDYHPEFPGGKPGGGRSTEPELFSFEEIGKWADRFYGFTRAMSVGETPVGGGTGFLTPDQTAERGAKKLEGLGRGMLGALLKGLLDHGVEPRLGMRARELVREDGAVRGVRFESGEVVRCNRGVILATGGFERDPELVRDFLRGPISTMLGIPECTGDGLRMAMSVGAQLGVMREAWWVPVVAIPGFDGAQYSGHGVQLVQRERTLPRTIMINDEGRRFTNEAANYNALGGPSMPFIPPSSAIRTSRAGSCSMPASRRNTADMDSRPGMTCPAG